MKRPAGGTDARADCVASAVGHILLMLTAAVLLAAVAGLEPARAAETAAEVDNPAQLQVQNARVRNLIPGQDKTVAYFEVFNPGPLPIELVRIESDNVRAIEFHTTFHDGNIMRMRRLDSVTVPAGGRVHFQSGGNHLMLFGVRSLPSAVPITLMTEDGRGLTVMFERIPIGAME